MNFWIAGKRPSLEKIIRKSNIIILNDEETRQLTGEAGIIQGGKKLLEMGPEVAVIKKGEHGSIMMSKDSYFVAPAYPVQRVVDPTGAGDSFAGGLVGYLAKNENFGIDELRKAVIYGTVIASFNVEDFSFKRLASLTKKELHDRWMEIKKMISY
jgi:sugar/nucleoside kinase (ribokinase family)